MWDNKVIGEVEYLEDKIDSILGYLYSCDGFTQTGSTFYRDACISREFRNYRSFSEELTVILRYMESINLVKFWKCDKVHHTYYTLTNNIIRKLNLEALLF